MKEKFQQRTLASFTRQQIGQVLEWSLLNGVQGENIAEKFDQALDNATLDEKGKPMSEKGRNRLKYAFNALSVLGQHRMKLADISGEVRVLNTLDPDEVQVTWDNPAYQPHL